MHRVNLPIKLALLGGLLTAATGSAHAEQCGNRLVSVGDAQGEVLARCGSPSWVTSRLRLRADQPGTSSHARLVVREETWSFDLGPHRLTRHFRFSDGRLVAIDTGSYGTAPVGRRQASLAITRSEDESAARTRFLVEETRRPRVICFAERVIYPPNPGRSELKLCR